MSARGTSKNLSGRDMHTCLKAALPEKSSRVQTPPRAALPAALCRVPCKRGWFSTCLSHFSPKFPGTLTFPAHQSLPEPGFRKRGCQNASFRKIGCQNQVPRKLRRERPSKCCCKELRFPESRTEQPGGRLPRITPEAKCAGTPYIDIPGAVEQQSQPSIN